MHSPLTYSHLVLNLQPSLISSGDGTKPCISLSLCPLDISVSGNSFKQSHCIGMFRSVENGIYIRILNNSAGIHNGNLVSDLGYHSQVMSYHYNSRTRSFFKLIYNSSICASMVTSRAVVVHRLSQVQDCMPKPLRSFTPASFLHLSDGYCFIRFREAVFFTSLSISTAFDKASFFGQILML